MFSIAAEIASDRTGRRIAEPDKATADVSGHTLPPYLGKLADIL